MYIFIKHIINKSYCFFFRMQLILILIIILRSSDRFIKDKKLFKSKFSLVLRKLKRLRKLLNFFILKLVKQILNASLIRFIQLHSDIYVI